MGAFSFLFFFFIDRRYLEKEITFFF